MAVLLALIVGILTPVAVAAAPSPVPAGSYRVKAGDTISSIALKMHVSGGWQALYDANKNVVGTDPGRLSVGATLKLPPPSAPPVIPTGSYVVRSGDTLTTIAARLHLTGGPGALYEANRTVIGPDPNRLSPGAVLRSPAAVQPPAATTPARGASTGAVSPTNTAPSVAPAAPAPAPAATLAPAPAAVPAPALVTHPARRTGHAVLIAALLGVALVLLVAWVVYRLLPLREPKQRLPREGAVVVEPAPPLQWKPLGRRADEVVAPLAPLAPLQVFLPEQREQRPPPEIRLHLPPADSQEEGGKSGDRISA